MLDVCFYARFPSEGNAGVSAPVHYFIIANKKLIPAPVTIVFYLGCVSILLLKSGGRFSSCSLFYHHEKTLIPAPVMVVFIKNENASEINTTVASAGLNFI